MRRESVQRNEKRGTIAVEATMIFMRFRTEAPEGSDAVRAIARLVNVAAFSMGSAAVSWCVVYIHTHW